MCVNNHIYIFFLFFRPPHYDFIPINVVTTFDSLNTIISGNIISYIEKFFLTKTINVPHANRLQYVACKMLRWSSDFLTGGAIVRCDYFRNRCGRMWSGGPLRVWGICVISELFWLFVLILLLCLWIVFFFFYWRGLRPTVREDICTSGET